VAPEDRTPPHPQQDTQAAGGGPVGVGAPTYAEAAERLLDNGYAPLPLAPGKKRPIPGRWSETDIDAAQVARWSRQHPHSGVGLRTGSLVAVDIDILDPDLAHQAGILTQARLGATLMRVGRWPKRLYIYRTEAPFRKIRIPGVEVLGQGQQVVAFGQHPDTGAPYHWPLGETPLDVALDQLPTVNEAACRDLVAELAQLCPGSEAPPGRPRNGGGGGQGQAPLRDAEGRIVEGRDGWLSSIAYHVVQDALDAGAPFDASALATTAWLRFVATANLDRPKKDGRAPYGAEDAARKVADKLRLLREGRLPPRRLEAVTEPASVDRLDLAEARLRLDATLVEACARIFAWHAGDRTQDAPRIGVRATVGLGKSAVARRRLLELQRRLVTAGGPSRLVICTPSHALAEETAAEWRAAGASVAVLRGYEARHPALRQPICRDLAAVRAALSVRATVQTSVCADKAGRVCRHFHGCLKQANRRELTEAEVVVAPYDALFSGFPISPDEVALILIDEGCWPRAVEVRSDLRVETFADDLLDQDATQAGIAAFGGVADLRDLRRRAAMALLANGPGPVSRKGLRTAGLAPDEVELAVSLELRRLRDPGLYPGMPETEREPALRRAQLNARTYAYVAIWRAIGRLLSGESDLDGRLAVGAAHPETGLQPILAQGVKALHVNLRGRPLLHLDATLRPDLATAVLPGLEVTDIEAAAPAMEVRLVTGGFGKRALSPAGAAAPEERARRTRRLEECVTYVRWHARRLAPGRVLVVTYKDIEPAFADIPGVETGHFNAIAGLDVYRDVRLLVVVGRPLPPAPEVGRLCGAFFGQVPTGRYRPTREGVRMCDGSVRAVRVMRHEDPKAELLRAAICDDEVIQAIGRGRGVNRTAANPLEVHVLADVALPLAHDRLLVWEMEKPTILQRMLLDGIAIDSPGDAAVLHPDLFINADQAQKAFERAGFSRQTPPIIIGEMSAKSAAYRRPGRGRGWQRAWWVDGSAEEARAALERAIGLLDGWKLD
jgi:hypothetical protein